MHDRIGKNVLQPVFAEPQFVVAQHRVVLNQHVRRRARVMFESAQRQLRGLDAAADDRPAFQHQAAITRLCQVGGGDQAIVAGAGNDNVESIFLEACCPAVNGVTARGASAAVFTNPRRLIVLIWTLPLSNFLRFLLNHFLDAGPKVFQHHRRPHSARAHP